MDFITVHHPDLGLESIVARSAFETEDGLAAAGWIEGPLPGSEPEPYPGGGNAFVIGQSAPAPKKPTSRRKT